MFAFFVLVFFLSLLYLYTANKDFQTLKSAAILVAPSRRRGVNHSANLPC